MLLAILGQDLHSMELALWDKGIVLKRGTFGASPEEYLKTIDQVVREWDTSIEGIDGVIVVTGPGSFTASRVSTTMANALGFARLVPIYTIENPNRLPIDTLLATFSPTSQPATFAFPTYDRPAHITAPKHVGPLQKSRSCGLRGPATASS